MCVYFLAGDMIWPWGSCDYEKAHKIYCTLPDSDRVRWHWRTVISIPRRKKDNCQFTLRNCSASIIRNM